MHGGQESTSRLDFWGQRGVLAGGVIPKVAAPATAYLHCAVAKALGGYYMKSI